MMESNRAIEATAAIPVIDIAALRARDAAGSRRVADQLGDACERIGFFYIVGHGIPEAAIADVFVAAHRFFSQPLERKMQYSMEAYSRCFRGYAPVLSELADGKRNSYELMEFSVELGEDDPDVIRGKPMHGPNLWPAIPGYRAAIDCYVALMNALGFDLMRGIALSLGLAEDFFEAAFNGRSFWQFRTTHYPEPDEIAAMSAELTPTARLTDVPIGDYACGAHTDYGCLTVLLADGPGLQVQGRNGVWFNAPAIAGAYICNIGDMLQYWTGSRYVATRHRVLTKGPRISLPFFFQPDYETIVRPVVRPGDTAAERAPIKYGPYAFEKFKGIYPNCRSYAAEEA